MMKNIHLYSLLLLGFSFNSYGQDRFSSSLVLNDSDRRENYVYAVSNGITAKDNFTVGEKHDITLNAGNAIQLLPNTEIKAGSVFLAEIKESITGLTSFEGETKKRLMFFPNPTSGPITISLKDSKIISLSISSIMNSKSLYDETIKASDSHQLDLSGFQKGIYILKVQNEEGEIFIEKIIKE